MPIIMTRPASRYGSQILLLRHRRITFPLNGRPTQKRIWPATISTVPQTGALIFTAWVSTQLHQTRLMWMRTQMAIQLTITACLQWTAMGMKAFLLSPATVAQAMTLLLFPWVQTTAGSVCLCLGPRYSAQTRIIH